MLVFKVHFGIRCRLQPLLRDLGYDILDKYEKIDFMSLTEADQKGMLDVIPALYFTSHFISYSQMEKQRVDLRSFFN